MDRFLRTLHTLVRALDMSKDEDDGIVLLVFRFALPFFFFLVLFTFIVWFVLEIRTMCATRQRSQPKAKKE